MRNSKGGYRGFPGLERSTRAGCDDAGRARGARRMDETMLEGSEADEGTIYFRFGGIEDEPAAIRRTLREILTKL